MQKPIQRGQVMAGHAVPIQLQDGVAGVQLRGCVCIRTHVADVDAVTD